MNHGRDHGGADGDDHAGHSHGVNADADFGKLAVALALIVAFMAAEVTVGILASSLALLSDAVHIYRRHSDRRVPGGRPARATAGEGRDDLWARAHRDSLGQLHLRRPLGAGRVNQRRLALHCEQVARLSPTFQRSRTKSRALQDPEADVAPTVPFREKAGLEPEV